MGWLFAAMVGAVLLCWAALLLLVMLHLQCTQKEVEMATFGEVYNPAMEITDQAEADAYFERVVTEAMAAWGRGTRAEVEKIIRDNLGYWAGYYDNETRERVERLFRCAHPIFGAIAVHGPPTPEQALELGRNHESLKDGYE